MMCTEYPCSTTATHKPHMLPPLLIHLPIQQTRQLSKAASHMSLSVVSLMKLGLSQDGISAKFDEILGTVS